MNSTKNGNGTGLDNIAKEALEVIVHFESKKICHGFYDTSVFPGNTLKSTFTTYQDDLPENIQD